MSDEIVVLVYFVIFAALISFVFWGAWRAYNKKGFALFLVMWACIVLCVIFSVRSTLPSSAPRRQAVGIISSITNIKQGRSHSYTIDFRADTGLSFRFDAAATPLFFSQGRDKVEVTYLDEERAGKYRRAIKFRALTGPRAGEHTEVNADWFGPWLGVLFSAIVGIAAVIGSNSNKRTSQRGLANTT